MSTSGLGKTTKSSCSKAPSSPIINAFASFPEAVLNFSNVEFYLATVFGENLILEMSSSIENSILVTSSPVTRLPPLIFQKDSYLFKKPTKEN